MKIAFIDHYDSFSFNLIDWLRSGPDPLVVERVCHDDRRGLDRVAAAELPLVLSPGPGHPDPSPAVQSLLGEALGHRPVLGVCLGHQILARLAGLAVGRCRAPWHGAARRIRVVDPGGFMARMPSTFRAASYNSLTVADSRGASLVKVSARCETDGEIQALEYGTRGDPGQALGVQFHPESFMSENQEALLGNWKSQVFCYFSKGNRHGRFTPDADAGKSDCPVHSDPA